MLAYTKQWLRVVVAPAQATALGATTASAQATALGATTAWVTPATVKQATRWEPTWPWTRLRQPLRVMKGADQLKDGHARGGNQDKLICSLQSGVTPFITRLRDI